MEEKLEILGEIEALIFLSKEQLSIEELSNFFEIEKEKILEYLEELKEIKKCTGVNLKIENNHVFLVSNPIYGLKVKNFFNPEVKLKKLSKQNMETLAIIAFKGPITKSEIENIRGVGCETSLSSLLFKNLIYISGKKKAIGTPNLYEVTENFYSYIGVEGKDELFKINKNSWILKRNEIIDGGN